VQIYDRLPSSRFSTDLETDKELERSFAISLNRAKLSSFKGLSGLQNMIIIASSQEKNRRRKHPGITFCIGNRSFCPKLLFPFSRGPM